MFESVAKSRYPGAPWSAKYNIAHRSGGGRGRMLYKHHKAPITKMGLAGEGGEWVWVKNTGFSEGNLGNPGKNVDFGSVGSGEHFHCEY